MKKISLLWVMLLAMITTINAQTDDRMITPQNAQNVVQIGHFGDGAIYHLAMSPTGEHFAVAGYMGVWIFESDNPQTPLHHLDGHDARVLSVSFSADGRFIATSGEDGKFVVWDVQTGKPLFLSTEAIDATDSSVRGAGFIRNDYLVSVTFYGDIFTWDLRLGELYTQIVADVGQPSLRIFALSPNEDYLALGTMDGRIQLYRLIPEEFPSGGGLVDDGIIVSDIDFVYDLEFDSAGTRLVATSLDGNVIAWDMTTKIEILNQKLDCVVGAVTFDSQQSDRLIISCDNELRIYSFSAGRFIGDIPAHKDTIFDLVFHPTDDRFISVEPDAIRIWEGSGTPHLSADISLHFSDSIWSITYAPINQAIVTIKDELRQYDLATGTYSVLSNAGYGTGHVSSQDSEYLLIAPQEGGLDVFNVVTGEIDFHEPTASFPSAISPNATLLAYRVEGEYVQLTDITTGELIHQLDGGEDYLTGIAFSPDGSKLVTCGFDFTLLVWDVATGEMLYRFPRQDTFITACVYSPDGTKIFTPTYDGPIWVWDAIQLELIETWEGHNSSVNLIAFSPDGQMMASGGEGATILLWDVATGDLLNTLIGHRNDVSGIAFSEDGTTIITASYDGTIRMWGLPTAN